MPTLRNPRLLLASAFVILLGALPACRPRPAPPPVSAGGNSGGQIMSAQDEQRLRMLAATRAKERDTGGYRIGPDDLLQIRIPDLLSEDDRPAGIARVGVDSVLPPVAGAPTFSDGLRVSAGGDVTIPLLGSVRAAGLTPRALESEIAHELVAKGLLSAPQVTVSLAEARSGVVAVVGSVEHPGMYPLTRPGARLSQMIWTAGGPNKDAGRVAEFVPTGQDGAPIRVDVDRLLYARAPNARIVDPPVRPGDAVSIAPAGNVQVDGWVGKPGSYPVTRGLTLTGAVAAAGGPLFAADQHRATLKRARGGDAESFTVDLDAVARGESADLAVADGDVVRLPYSTARVVPWAVWSTVKEMVRVGGNVLLF
jgi:polysaccharide biosynthesis/export protein